MIGSFNLLNKLSDRWNNYSDFNTIAGSFLIAILSGIYPTNTDTIKRIATKSIKINDRYPIYNKCHSTYDFFN